MTVTLGAIAAVAAALLEITLWPYLDVAGAHPHLVLVGAITLASVASLEVALAWGFTGGLMLDVLAPRPLGASALALLLVVGISVAAARALGQLRLRVAAPLAVAVPLSVLYSLVVALVVGAVQDGGVPRNAVPTLLPGAIFDLVLVVIASAAVLVLRSRQDEQERVGW